VFITGNSLGAWSTEAPFGDQERRVVRVLSWIEAVGRCEDGAPMSNASSSPMREFT
jgi:hypothetical protein